MGPLAGIGSQFPALLAALILATDRKIVRRLRDAGAINAAHAVEFDPPGPIGHARLRRMLSVGAVRDTGANRYYLDESGYQAWRVVRRKRALAILAVMAVVIAMLVVGGVVKLR
jgi:hypothetical protein